MNYERARRLRSVGFFILCAGALIAARLYFLQMVRADELAARADRIFATQGEGPFNRGSIFFTSKNGETVLAASLKTGFTLIVEASELDNGEETYAALSSLAPITREAFFAAALKKRGATELARRLSPESAEAIAALKLAGVYLVRERWRFYPGDARAAHLLGFVGSDGERVGGRYGLERSYEETLARAAASPYANFFSELAGLVRADTPAAGEVVTSIEPAAQSFLEEVLSGVQKKFSARETAGIIMDPKTGAILALAATPAFNPNDFAREKDWRVFVNPLVENVYEFGSIVKPLTIAAGIEGGAITPASTYTDEGSLTLDGKTIYNFDKKGRGVVSMQEVLNQSLNTGAATVAEKLGTEKFAEYLRRFGIASETGIDLPNEASPLVENLKSPRQIEYATASFGQGIALTPVAMLRALSALANGGELPNPHLATRISYELGGWRTPSFGAEEPRRAVSRETAEAVTKMLVKVVDTALLGGSMKLAGWSVAAKTGTAQIAKPTGGYYDDRYLHSFFGYFPAYEPRFIVFLYTVEPKEVTFASHTLTAPFFDIAKFLLNYYAIPPDR